MAYIPENLRVTNEDEIRDLINTANNRVSDLRAMIAIDYFYHRQENNYDGGLSMLDRVGRKLRHIYPNLDIQEMKDRVRNANNEQDMFVTVINEIFRDDADIGYYGF
jgi:hypothetical protein